MTNLQHVSLVLGSVHLRMSQLLLQVLQLPNSLFALILRFSLGLFQSNHPPLTNIRDVRK